MQALGREFRQANTMHLVKLRQIVNWQCLTRWCHLRTMFDTANTEALPEDDGGSRFVPLSFRNPPLQRSPREDKMDLPMHTEKQPLWWNKRP